VNERKTQLEGEIDEVRSLNSKIKSDNDKIQNEFRDSDIRNKAH
jgi:hypothetical protein